MKITAKLASLTMASTPTTDDVSDAGDGPAFVDEDNTANNDDDFPEKGAHAKPDPDSGYRLT
jgi:hypothetical protein